MIINTSDNDNKWMTWEEIGTKVTDGGDWQFHGALVKVNTVYVIYEKEVVHENYAIVKSNITAEF